MSRWKTMFGRQLRNHAPSRRIPPRRRRRLESLESRCVFSAGLPGAAIAAFPDVCFTPPEAPVDAHATTNLAGGPATAQAVVVIHHADGTIEWIYDLPSVVKGLAEEGGGTRDFTPDRSAGRGRVVDVALTSFELENGKASLPVGVAGDWDGDGIDVVTAKTDIDCSGSMNWDRQSCMEQDNILKFR